jgi:hypothetical protein
VASRLTTLLFTKDSDAPYPPRKRVAVRALMRTRLQYSSRKKRTKGNPEYSVKKSATSSLSASGRSKLSTFDEAV